ncbi:type II toxin-antitoxin system Phd/YefM family antitoxin [Aphanothece microscopica]|uniref:type II toxin-antitoxin system Phd/YefM family antitoxin n=2 Tax=Aphanothece TaxID=1121 RepID=UPI003CE538E1
MSDELLLVLVPLRQALERYERKANPLLQDPGLLEQEEGQGLLDVICMQFLADGEALSSRGLPLLVPCRPRPAVLTCCTGSWTPQMQVVSFSEARESFKAVLDRVEADADVTLITRRHAQGAVLMSLDTYNSLMETVHLLRAPANATHLQRSLEQADRGELLDHPLIDADLVDAGN